MMMPALTGKRMGLKKIRRIMKTYNLTSSIPEGSAFQAHGWSGTEKECET